MHIFLSAGEPSGDQHAAHLMRELRARSPRLQFSGFGGPHMEGEGFYSLFRLTDLAVMGVWAVLPLLWTFYKLVRHAGRYLREQRPDAVVLIDFPGFNWWIARKAKQAGIPVFYYMPPQLWAWAPWRIRKVRRFVDHVLAALPFEADWYAQRGIDVTCVGHPFFDEVAHRKLDDAFCRSLLDGSASAQHDRNTPAPSAAPPRMVGLLPGSRNQEVRRNFPVMLRVARKLHAAHPNVRFAVACYKESHRDHCRSLLEGRFADLPIDLYLGRTSEIIDTVECCLMVSGSVSLELLARGTPGVVLYRGSWLLWLIAHTIVTCNYMSLPNLIADRMLMPEFPFRSRVHKHVRKMTAVLSEWLSSDQSLAAARRDLEELRAGVVRTGGVGRAAEAILARLPATARVPLRVAA